MQSFLLYFRLFFTVFWCGVPPFGSNIGQGKRFLANRLLILFLYKRYDFIYFSQGVSGRWRIQNDSFPEDFC